MAEFRLPSLGAEMEDALLSQWLVHVGDRVRKGQSLAVVETGKGAIELEGFVDGEVEALLVAQGERVPVGTVLARLRTEAETVPAQDAAAAVGVAAPVVPSAVSPETVATPVAVAPGAPSPVPAPAPAPAPAAARVHASPAARKRARELGIDLAQVQAVLPGEAIGIADVERHAARPATAVQPGSAPAESDRTATLRRTLAGAMARSKREIPHYYLGLSIDMRRAVAFLADANRDKPATDRMLPIALLLRAVALAAREVPTMNGFWRDGAFRPSAEVHLGVAVSLRQGSLVAPALQHADARRATELMADLRGVVERARAGRLRGTDMIEPTLTVTNLGDRGADLVHGVIHPPQVALVGFGRLALRPWLDGVGLVAAPIVTATLAADHRVSDGMEGSRFLTHLEQLLQKPEVL